MGTEYVWRRIPKMAPGSLNASTAASLDTINGWFRQIISSDEASTFRVDEAQARFLKDIETWKATPSPNRTLVFERLYLSLIRACARDADRRAVERS